MWAKRYLTSVCEQREGSPYGEHSKAFGKRKLPSRKEFMYIENPSTHSFDNADADTLVHVATFLDPDSLSEMKKVCKAWRNIFECDFHAKQTILTNALVASPYRLDIDQSQARNQKFYHGNLPELYRHLVVRREDNQDDPIEEFRFFSHNRIIDILTAAYSMGVVVYDLTQAFPMVHLGELAAAGCRTALHYNGNCLFISNHRVNEFVHSLAVDAPARAEIEAWQNDVDDYVNGLCRLILLNMTLVIHSLSYKFNLNERTRAFYIDSTLPLSEVSVNRCCARVPGRHGILLESVNYFLYGFFMLTFNQRPIQISGALMLCNGSYRVLKVVAPFRARNICNFVNKLIFNTIPTQLSNMSSQLCTRIQILWRSEYEPIPLR